MMDANEQLDQAPDQANGASNPELDRLIHEASALEVERAAASPEAIQAQQEQAVQLGLAEANSNGFRMILTMAAGVFGMVGYPSVQAALTSEAIEPLALTWGPLAAKYGYDLSNMGAQYREEIAAAFATIPVGLAVWNGIKADAAGREAAKASKPGSITNDPADRRGPDRRGLKPGDLGYVEPTSVQA